jgi:predicted nucleic acid-binding protein
VGYVETVRAVVLAAGRRAARRVDEEWPAFDVIEADQALVRDAADLAPSHDLGNLDALHLAAARLLRRPELLVATWDRRLHAAAIATGLRPVPERLR